MIKHINKEEYRKTVAINNIVVSVGIEPRQYAKFETCKEHEQVELVFNADIDGYETEIILTYTRCYPIAQYPGSTTEYDCPQIKMRSIDCHANCAITASVQHSAIGAALELNDYILNTKQSLKC